MCFEVVSFNVAREVLPGESLAVQSGSTPSTPNANRRSGLGVEESLCSNIVVCSDKLEFPRRNTSRMSALNALLKEPSAF